METAEIFWTERSQAVRLPKEFQFDGKEVQIRRHGNAVILEPIASEPIAENWAWLDSLVGKFDSDAADAAVEQPPMQERPALDKFFG